MSLTFDSSGEQMSLTEVVEFVRATEKRLVVRGPSTARVLVDELCSRFGTQNVRIEYERESSRPTVATLSSDGEQLVTVDRAALEELSHPRPGIDEGSLSPEVRRLLSYLKETTFVSHDVEQMRRTSREIEDRAFRIGGGTIHAGFQQLTRFEPARLRYESLAECGVDTHVYGVPDVTPRTTTVAVHAVESSEIRRTWFVLFDGGADPLQQCALVAHEEGDRQYYGIWTYDPVLVDAVAAHVGSVYGSDRGRKN